MDVFYLIQYGLWHQVGRFGADSPDLQRGETVVVRTHRGTELGEVLIKTSSVSQEIIPSDATAPARVLRAADHHDLELARQRAFERGRYFERCREVIRDRDLEFELLDIELLLDERRAVLYCLGARQPDSSALGATFDSTCNLDVHLELIIGPDPVDDRPSAMTSSCESCGGCGSAAGGCHDGIDGARTSNSSQGGCADCGIKRIIAAQRPAVAHR